MTGGRQDCSCGENVFYSSSLNLHQYVAMISIFSIAATMSPHNIPVLLYTKHFTYLCFLLLVLLLNRSASRFVFDYLH